MLVAGGLAAAIVGAVLACQNPAQPAVPAQTGAEEAGPGTEDGAGEFTVTLRVGEAGPEVPNSRAVAGPDAGGIQYGGIRNIVQVIALDAATGEVVDFQQVFRLNDGDTGISLTVQNLWTGGRYHFLVLMGHRERDYANENNPRKPEDPYSYTTDPPTLLAAGFLGDREISGAGKVAITMKPLVADTVFAYGGHRAQAIIPDPKTGKGIQLPAGVEANLVWTLGGGGIGALLDAQDKASLQSGGSGVGIDSGWGGLTLADQKTFIWLNGDIDPAEATAILGGEGHNQIILDLGALAAENYGSANFNLTYVPFGFGAMDDFAAKDPAAALWIIRNGVNDLAQNGKTVFPNTASTVSPWNGDTGNDPANGNGAVAFTFVPEEISHVDLTKALPAPVTGAKPLPEITEGRYIGNVAWTDTATGKTPEYFKGETVYAGTLTALAANSGIEISTDGFTVTHSGSSQIVYAPDGKWVGVVFLKTGTVWEYNGSFSGSSTGGAGDVDSAIDIIRQAKKEGGSSLSLKLFPLTEEVNPAAADTDIKGSLVLNNTNSPASVTLDGGGKTIHLPQTMEIFKISVITVGDGVTLTLKNITFKGNGNKNEKALISVTAGGTLVLEDGAVITGHKNNNVTPRGGGVYVGGGSFIMNGGEIRGNIGNGGSGVYVENGTFTMNGGEISGNDRVGSSNGGAVYVKNGTFTMNNGVISGNTSNTGGGVFVSESIFTMNNGEISGNKTIDGDSGGSGGGVFNQYGTFTMNNGVISGNETGGYSCSGGGVLNQYGTFTMNNGAIRGNKITGDNRNGGGVYNTASGSTFTMNGGEISGNTITGANGKGGGVYGGTTFTMYGGEISGNSITGGNGKGGGVYGVKTFTMYGGIIYGIELIGNTRYGAKKNTAAVYNPYYIEEPGTGNGDAFYKDATMDAAKWNKDKDGATFVDLPTTDTMLDLR
jgi:hypothetical protein